MHIALFVSDLGGGGTQRRVLALARTFAREGHRVDLVTANREGAFRDLVSPEIRVLSMDNRLARLPFIQQRRGLRLPAVVGRLAEYLEEEKPDILLASSNPANLAALAARARSAHPRRSTTPVVITVNVDLGAALAGRNPIHRGLLRLMLRRHYARADAVIAISEGVAASIAEVAAVPRERIVTIPNPVDCEAIRRQGALPIVHPWLAPGAPPLILAVGKLKPQKDFVTLIRAFARLRKTHAANLMILGEGKQHARLLALARDLGLRESIDLPGFADNPHAWMSRAALFVLSSRWEGFSNVLAEALAVGCPVVSTDCPSGPAELLKAGTLGALVTVGDDAGLAAAMTAALERPCAAERLMARADEFSVEQAAARYLAVLREVVGRLPERSIPQGERAL